VATYVMGAVMREAQEMRVQRDQEREMTALTEEEIQAQRERFRTWFEAAGRYPRIVRLMESGVDPDDPATRDARFQFGLDCVLDGIAVRITSSAVSPPAPEPPRSQVPAVKKGRPL
jgi:tetracycline repressor-like protein